MTASEATSGNLHSNGDGTRKKPLRDSPKSGTIKTLKLVLRERDHHNITGPEVTGQNDRSRLPKTSSAYAPTSLQLTNEYANSSKGTKRMLRNRPILDNAVWIDWGRHRRTHTLSAALGVPLLEVLVPGNRSRRYVVSAWQTLIGIHERRPKIVIATNPSIILGFLLLMLRPCYRFALISDAHYAGVQAPRTRPLLQRFLDLLNPHVDLVIVTNVAHAEYLRLLGANAYVCPDPVPNLPISGNTDPVVADRSVFLICSFDADEPFDAVFEAFQVLSKEAFVLFVSGRYTKANIDPLSFPGVTFLGFVSDELYCGYLRACSVVMDLTSAPNCLVCGAYEALALQKPLVLSNSAALIEYFSDACVFTDNTVEGIADSVRLAYSRRDELSNLANKWVRKNALFMEEKILELHRRIISVAFP